MNKKKKFFITASIPYVNAAPHIGHALEFVQTDVMARYHRLLGEEVVALSGGDENALKNVQAAERVNVPVQEFVDKNEKLFHRLSNKLNTKFDIWQKGSDKTRHFPSSQKLWELCDQNGDIYKKKYTGLYCVGCETFYSPEEIDENSECFEHPGKKLDKVSEENYFFKLSKYQDKLIKLIENDEYKVIPETRKNEVLAFLRGGLEDLSISRTNERAKNWGVPVPGDDSQRIYVWFDALNIYQSGVGFGWDDRKYKQWWPADVHVVGKGIIRFHAIYWPAFLLSAGLKLPKNLFVHGYYTINEKKMSKSLGNVIDPIDLIEQYGADVLHYYFLAKTHPFKDSDFTKDKLAEVYTADLANGLGNLVSRVAKLCETSGFEFPLDEPNVLRSEVVKQIENYRFDLALKNIWVKISDVDKQMDETKPWKLQGAKLKSVLYTLVAHVRQIGYELTPFLPETSEKILTQFKGPKIKSAKPLFPRLN